MALMPLRIFYEGRDDSPRHFDGKLNPFLLLFSVAGFLPLGTLPTKIRREQRIWCGFGILFILIAFLTAPVRIRYILPALPAFVILTMIGIFRSCKYIRKIDSSSLQTLLNFILSMVIIVMFAYNANYFVDRFRKVEPLEYFNGKVTRDVYIARRRPEYPLIKYLNAHLAPDALILGLFLGQRMYYFDREVSFNEGWLLKAIANSKSSQDIAMFFSEKGITHFMVRKDLFRNWLGQNIKPSDVQKFQEFWKGHIRKLKEVNGFVLYSLVR
jgi:hypothetical protein